METILAAVITGGVTLIGVLIANGKDAGRDRDQAGGADPGGADAQQLCPAGAVIEEQLKVANHRIADLEEHEYERERN